MKSIDLKLNNKNSKEINYLLDKYINITPGAKVKFESSLNNEIRRLKLSNEDSIFILLHIIYKIININIKHENINSEVFNLIRRVKVYNSEGRSDLKYKILFYRQYTSEILILMDYIEKKYKNISKLENPSQNLRNKNPWLYSLKEDLINSKDYKKFQKKDIERYKKIKRRENRIKEKYKQLERNKKFREINKKIERQTSSKNIVVHNQISNQKKEKQKYNNLKNHGIKIKEEEFNKFTEKISEFNLKPISKWIEQKPYNLISDIHKFQGYATSEEFDKFKIYYNNLDKFNLIKNQEKSYRNFLNILSVVDGYLDYEKRQKLKQKYASVYNSIKDIDKLFLKKIYSEINYLENFIQGYCDLLNYSNFQKTSDNNVIKRINKNYLVNKKSENNELFKDITDPAKIAAIIMEEKNIKVIAGAGTGKTFTIQSKVKYLIEQMNVKSEKILCLCYTHKSAVELDKRVNSSLNDSNVEVCTFHEFARRVDTACGGDKSTNRYLLDEVIRNYIKKIIKDPIKSNLLMEYFIYYINPNDEEEFKSLKEFIDKHKYHTLQQKHFTYGVNENLFSNENTDKEQPKNIFQRAITHYCNFHNKSVRELIEEANMHEEQGIEWNKRKIRRRLRSFYKCLSKAYDYEKALEYFKYVLALYKYFDIEIQVISKDFDHIVNFSQINELVDSLSHEEIDSLYYEFTDETLKGEKVRSLGEFIIANYLFMHNINYEYEKRYEINHFSKFIQCRFLNSGHYFCINEFSEKSKKDIVEHFIKYERRKAAYKPDFYLTDYDIYLEHFGLNENGEATWLKGDEKEKYEKLVESKRIWHEMYGTKLIETYSYYVSKNTLITELEKLLIQNKVTIGKRDPKEILDILLINSQVGVYNRFSKLIKNFINIFEANHFPKKKLENFKRNNEYEIDLYSRKRQELFLNMVSEIYDIYYEHNQSNDIDHNREISNALNLIKSKKYNRKFDYILIDEYQDINFIRCELIQELQKNSNANVFVVGDDWQSIYGFNGSNVNLFIDFEKYFPNCETITLSETFRNSQEISDIARIFIRKNKNQEPKKLKYVGNNIDKNPIRLVSYSDQKYSKVLNLDSIIGDILSHKSKNNLKILILGRMNIDIEGFINNRIFKEKHHPKFRKIVYSKNPSLDITFMTIHQSKGLEYDEVIVLNLEDELMGFPSQIVDDPILKFVKINHENFPFAEERRLLYVALTRTKHNVYIMYPSHNPSQFVKEFKNDFKLRDYPLRKDTNLPKNLFEDNDFYKYKEIFSTDLQCPGCENGKIAIIILHNKHGAGKHSVFVGCSDYCKNYIGGPYLASIDDIKYIEKCPDPECNGILVRQGDILKCSMNYHGGCMETKELKLDEDDLKYKDYEK